MADDIVERPCAECKGTGVAEVIGGYERGCDACFGEGVQRFTTMEAGLLDQCEALEADNARLRSALKEREEALLEACLALEPIARKVFNDNGDHTIDTSRIDDDVYSACYYASRTVHDVLARAQLTGGQHGK